MTFDYNHHNYWSDAAFNQHSLDPSSFDQGSFYGGAALSIETSSPPYGSGVFSDAIAIVPQGWTPLQSPSQLGQDVSPSTASSNVPFPGSSRSFQASRRPSAEAVARRRKQNRVSQAAWRARNKELVEELRQKITEHVEYNQSLHQAMQSLLETTENLKKAIQTALDQPLPRSPQENHQASIGEARSMSLGPFHESSVHEYEGLSRQGNLTETQDEDFQGIFV